jgi:hypothetical protein
MSICWYEMRQRLFRELPQEIERSDEFLYVQDSRASFSAGDDCEGADDETSEEDEEETISDWEMFDNRHVQVDYAHDHRRADQEREIGADQMVGSLFYNLFSIVGFELD